MYKKYPSGEITLWCDGQTTDQEDDGNVRKKRKKDGDGVSRRQEHEEEVDDIFKQLKEKHGQKYDTPRLRLWARQYVVTYTVILTILQTFLLLVLRLLRSQDGSSLAM